MSTPILKITHLTKQFGGVTAAQDINLEVKQGDFLGIIGPNGSGKTTLINLITGFVKPNSGTVIYKGKDITGFSPNKIANLGLARTFQKVKPFQGVPAFKNLVVPLCSPRVKGRKAEGRYGDRDAIAVDLLEEVGFERDSAVPYKSAEMLPHGYLKRMELARCLALRPEIVILDELFSGMSVAEVAGTMPLIEKMQIQGWTIVMVEHRIKELFNVATRVIVLNQGLKIAEGTADEVIQDEAVREAYLGKTDDGQGTKSGNENHRPESGSRLG